MSTLDELNPDWEQAGRHGLASRAGLSMDGATINSTLLCRCCFSVVYKDPVPMCENSKSLEFLGFGFPLFYAFLKNCIILLISLICTYSSFALKSAITYNWIFC